MGTKSAGIKDEMRGASMQGKTCLDMAVRYLQGKSFLSQFFELETAREGDILIFARDEGIAIVLAIGNGRGYCVSREGKPSIVRFRDLTMRGKFMAGAKLGR